MRIIKLEIQDFRAFYGNHIIEFAKEGQKGKQNLLLYGENGSGKSSLLLAIKYILESADNEDLNFDDYKNIFREPPSNRYIEITLRESVNKPIIVSKWSPDVITTDIQDIKDAAQAKGILDYKKLLEVHFIHRQESKVNIFDLLIKSLLAQCINDIAPSKTFSEQWQDLIEIIPKRRKNNRQIDEFNRIASLFNVGLQSKLNELQDDNEKVIAEVPIWKQDKDYLEKAKDYLNIHHEPRIAAVYLRIAFEVILKEFCNERIKVIYKEEIKKLSSDDFWKEVKKAKKNDGTLYVNSLLAFDIELYRNIIMNPLSHSRITQAYSGEVGQAISTVENLKNVLLPSH